MFAANRFAAAKGSKIVLAAAMLMAVDAAYLPAFLTPAAGPSETAALQAESFFNKKTFNGRPCFCMNFISAAKIIGIAVAVIAANYNFPDLSYNTHFKCTPFFKTRDLQRVYG
jgi:hypothetical protein